LNLNQKLFIMSNTVKVMEVTNVALTIFKTKPPILYIFAEGIVPTLGYKNGKLLPYIYIKPPADGIWDFDFVADKPDGIVPQVLAPITADYMWEDFPSDLKGVRIRAAHNQIEAKLSSSDERELISKLA
jgi:hypothetical protein